MGTPVVRGTDENILRLHTAYELAKQHDAETFSLVIDGEVREFYAGFVKYLLEYVVDERARIGQPIRLRRVSIPKGELVLRGRDGGTLVEIKAVTE